MKHQEALFLNRHPRNEFGAGPEPSRSARGGLVSESRRKLALLVLPLAMALIVLWSQGQSFSFSTANTHPALTEEMAELFNRKSKQKLSSEEIKWLRQGAIEEDEPMRYVNHFYNPINGVGWSGKHFGSLSQEEGLRMGADSAPRAPLSALDWAVNQAGQAAYGRQFGNQTWQKAIKAYLDNDKKAAFIALGHILHLVEDMAVPDHTRDDTHAGIKGDPGSPFEDYAKDYTNYNKLTVAKALANRALPSFDSVQSAIAGLANYSNNNFFSEDTISNEEFSEPSIERLEKKIEVVGHKKVLLLYNARIKAHIASLSDDNVYTTKDKSFVLPSYRSHLFPQAVLTGAGVMELFFQEVEKYQKHPELLEPIAPDANQPFLQALAATPKLALLNTYDFLDKAVVRAQVALAKGQEAVKGLAQKVKLAALVAPFQATPLAPPPSAPHPTLSPEGRGDNGQVLGEAVEARESNTKNQTPPPKADPPRVKITKQASITNNQAKGVQGDKKIVSAPQLRNEKMDSIARPAAQDSLQNDRRETGGPDLPMGEQGDYSLALRGTRNDKTDSQDNGIASQRLANLWLASTTPRNDSPAAPARPAGPTFIGIFAPPPTTPSPSSERRGNDTPDASASSSSSPPDTIPPTAWITVLPATTTVPSFLVQWSGTDNVQPTPASYDIQYGILDSRFRGNDNWGDWLDWLLATTTASSYFTGQDEKTYGFRSRGRDQEGNQSAYPSTAETYTYLNLSAPSTPIIASHQNNQTLQYSDDVASTTDGVQITLAGAADPSDTVNITYSSSATTASTTATTTASSLGAWSKQITLSEGVNTISLQSQEADNDTSSSTAITINLNTAPSTITDLAVVTASTTATSTALFWTTPNQANLQIASSSAYYDVRYLAGAGCTVTETNFTSLSQAPSPPVPTATSGTAESFTIANLTENTNYCFGLKTHNGSQLSTLSNIASVTLPSAHGTDIAQTATSTNSDWGWNNIGEWWKVAQSFQPTRNTINGFEFTICRRYPDGWGVPGLRVILCKGLPNSTYLGGCDPGNYANNVVYRRDYSSAETEAMMPFCGGWAGVARRSPVILNFSFNAVSLAPGQTYSIILSSIGGAQMHPFQSSYQASTNPYAGGAIYYQDDNTWFKEKAGADWHFKTFY